MERQEKRFYRGNYHYNCHLPRQSSAAGATAAGRH
jgi:hypothetical protein